MIDMDKTYSTKLTAETTTEKILHAIKKALDEVGESDNWTIQLAGGKNNSVSIETKITKGKLIK